MIKKNDENFIQNLTIFAYLKRVKFLFNGKQNNMATKGLNGKKKLDGKKQRTLRKTKEKIKVVTITISLYRMIKKNMFSFLFEHKKRIIDFFLVDCLFVAFRCCPMLKTKKVRKKQQTTHQPHSFV